MRTSADDWSRGRQDEAVRSIAKMLLTERLDELAVTAQARLDREEPAYAGMIETEPGQKLAGMRRTLRLALTRLAGEAVPSEVAQATADVGRQRAEQGFPLPAVVRSFQLDLHTVWEAIIEEGRSRGLADGHNFLDGLLVAWEAIDANNIEVVDAYRRTQAHLDSHRFEIRRRAFERLILEGEHDDAVVAEASAALGMAAHGSFTVVVAAGVPIQHHALTKCRNALQQASLPFHFGYLGDELLGIVNSGRQPGRAIHRMLRPLDDWRCGTAEITGLGNTAAGVRLARAAMRSSVESGIRPIKSHWVGAIMSGNEELAGLMAGEVLTPLMKLRECDSIIETLCSFLELGSVAAVAEQTYRHRNTIRNRLKAVEDATGLSLAVPNEAALLAMATEWLKSPRGRAFYERYGPASPSASA
ncbi:helix-turn-helix domain-containing protein [Amycolatopsis pithecellobii]|uniref:Uncharacterized protein n=1 Tax=Amycolatopsis pithecellobii TaxID=664692 RepID=A0A6N7YWF5_9PSEU|nr:helix-turn-helix domain-containing protein [Amycolatopsis pithecellobii]MTD57417.1 hypothetical protein [Amycolatopsis pithecellobii]